MIVEILLFILTTLITYYYINLRKTHKYFDKNGVKYVKGVPVFGNVLKSTLLMKHLAEDVKEVYKAYPEERYIGFIDFTTPSILIRDPELIKQITVKDFDHFVDHEDFFSDFSPLMKASIICMKGGKWRDMRMTLGPAFTGAKIRQVLPFMMETSDDIIEYLNEHTNDVIDVGDVIKRYTNDVIASAVFGLKINSLINRDNEFYRTSQKLLNFTVMQKILMILATLFPTLCKAFGLQLFSSDVEEFFMRIVSETITYRQENHVQRPDMIQMLMDASKGKLKYSDNKHENGDIGFATVNEELKPREVLTKWSLDELAGQVLIFFIAGFETTASVLVMTIHELALNQEVQEKLYKEVKEFAQKNQKLEYNNIGELKYLDGVLNETLRKWTPATVLDRICCKPYKLPSSSPDGKPYQVNPGDLVHYSVNPLHMDPKYWPDPDTFNPERFSDENKHNIQPFTFLPFGVGPRNCMEKMLQYRLLPLLLYLCLGSGSKLSCTRFALLELKVLLYKLVLHFKIVKCEKTSEPLKLLPELFNVKAVGGTFVKIEPRV